MKEIEDILKNIALSNDNESLEDSAVVNFKTVYKRLTNNQKSDIKILFNEQFSIGVSDRLYKYVGNLLKEQIYLYHNSDVEKVKQSIDQSNPEIQLHGIPEIEYFQAWFKRRCEELEKISVYLNGKTPTTTSGYNPLFKINFNSVSYRTDFIRLIKPYFVKKMHTSKINKLFEGKVESNGKLGWQGDKTELAVFIQLLFENGVISKGERWRVASECFMLCKSDKCETITPKQLSNRQNKIDIERDKLLKLQNVVSLLIESKEENKM